MTRQEMKMIPAWLRLWISSALIGEIYPSIRAIAVRFTDEKVLTLRYYLDREPSEGDAESLSMVVAEVLAHTSSNEEIVEAREECIYSDRLLRNLDVLDGLVYARREYDTAEIQAKQSGGVD